MLQYSRMTNGVSYRGMAGYGFGQGESPQVQQLQVALKGLAQAAAMPSADPGVVTGTVTDQTITAIANVLGQLGKAVPEVGSIAPALAPALAAAAYSTSAKPTAIQLITQYANVLTRGVQTLAMKWSQSKTGPVPGATTPQGLTTAAHAACVPGGIRGSLLTHLQTCKPSVTGGHLVLTKGGPASTAGAVFPVGSIKTDGGQVWRIGIPKAALKAALGGMDPGIGGDYTEAASPVPKTTTPVDTTGKPLPEVDPKEFNSDTRPWYKKPLTYAIGGGVAVLGLVTWWALK